MIYLRGREEAEEDFNDSCIINGDGRHKKGKMEIALRHTIQYAHLAFPLPLLGALFLFPFVKRFQRVSVPHSSSTESQLIIFLDLTESKFFLKVIARVRAERKAPLRAISVHLTSEL